MFLSKRRISGKTYFYLDDRAAGKRFSVFVGQKKDLQAKLESAFDEACKKKAVELARVSLKKFRKGFFSFHELLLLETLKLEFGLLKKFFPESLKSFEEDEFVRYAQGSASVEGNSLSLQEAAIVLTKGASVPGKKIDEIREIENMKRARSVSHNAKKLNQFSLKKIHAAILHGFDDKRPGKYRDGPVFITGSQVRPPSAVLVKKEMERLFELLEKNKEKKHAVELAGEFHARFEKIHPFFDGNGRTGREILNLMLHKTSFPRAIINLENRQSYVALLERTQLSKEYKKFSKFVFSCLEKRQKEISDLLKENKGLLLKKL